MSDRLFVPLKGFWYDLFESGRKKYEMRGIRPGFTKRQVWIGRPVELRRGYAKGKSLWGTIADVRVVHWLSELPEKIVNDTIPISKTEARIWGDIREYQARYNKLIVFKIDITGDAR
jgi:predicted phosphoadenosine phosphosulfate sulfurtransferase